MISRITLLFLLVSALQAAGQDHDHPASFEGHQHEEDHHRNEIGLANSVVYLINDKSFGYGLHLHYTYNIPNSHFGAGASYEVIFSTHCHHMLGVTAIYQPVKGLNLNLSPGIAFEGGETSKPLFALHFEVSYEFEFHDFHFGPTVATGFDTEDYHVGLGIHLGYGF